MMDRDWYLVTLADGAVIETIDRSMVKKAIQEGQTVSKNTRVIFDSGPSTITLTVTTIIDRIKDI
ncbi:MAG: hypothetical protein ACRCUY_02865 [Thermoguttaceae bacterium]